MSEAHGDEDLVETSDEAIEEALAQVVTTIMLHGKYPHDAGQMNLWDGKLIREEFNLYDWTLNSFDAGSMVDLFVSALISDDEFLVHKATALADIEGQLTEYLRPSAMVHERAAEVYEKYGEWRDA